MYLETCMTMKQSGRKVMGSTVNEKDNRCELYMHITKLDVHHVNLVHFILQLNCTGGFLGIHTKLLFCKKLLKLSQICGNLFTKWFMKEIQ